MSKTSSASLVLVAWTATVVLTLQCSSAERIREIQTKTAVCDGCDIVGDFGQFEVWVTGLSGTCQTGDLDDNDGDDFSMGETDVFNTDDELGQCYRFELGDVSISTDVGMTLIHSGTDAGQLEFVQVLTEENSMIFQCNFDVYMDGSDVEEAEARDCFRIQ